MMLGSITNRSCSLIVGCIEFLFPRFGKMLGCEAIAHTRFGQQITRTARVSPLIRSNRLFSGKPIVAYRPTDSPQNRFLTAHSPDWPG